jgi:hypothetical protein
VVPRLIDTRAFWWLLHFQEGVHSLTAQTHLVSDCGDIDLAGMQFMDFVIVFDSLLMQE